MEKTNYESVVVLTPVLSEKMLQEAVSDFEKLITVNGGELIHKENWGLTKMAYPIQKKTTGFYQIYEFAAEADTEIVDKLELAFRRDEQVLRYRSEEHTSVLQSRSELVCRLLLEKKKSKNAHSRVNRKAPKKWRKT